MLERARRVRKEVSDTPGYAELRREIEDFVYGFLKCVGEDSFGGELTPRLSRVLKSLKIVVGPTGNWRFYDDARNLESVVLWEVRRFCTKLFYPEIAIDLDRGANLMPSLVIKLAYRLASVLFIAHRDLSRVSSGAYNSDLVPLRRKKLGDEKTINVNVIVDEVVESIQLVRKMPEPIPGIEG